jgi:diaminohydroxyphosphoribosylaminopyrimidine deaminase / 5-amino-6-(5-phosphoribosylamino)uracil reductase
MDHQAYLRYTLQLAEDYLGYCAPNPSVGSVIVNNGKILARAAHRGAGTAHAERGAIDSCEQIPPGSTLYVSLEPCCHWGRTAPCTDAIIEAGISEVYFAYLDPNPKVCGQGMTTLLNAGITCQQIVVPEINDFYQHYAHWVMSGLPWVRAKLALSLDGKIAGKGGAPLKLTDVTVDQFTHEKRYYSDAILTSVQTLLADNPRLDARLYGKAFAKPIYIIDTKCRLSRELQIFSTSKRLVLFHADTVAKEKVENLQALGVECRGLVLQGDVLPMRSVIKSIGSDGCHTVWVEAGGKCFQSLLSQHLVNTAFLYYSPKIIGTESLPAFTQAFTIPTRPRWQQMGVDSVCEINFELG